MEGSWQYFATSCVLARMRLPDEAAAAGEAAVVVVALPQIEGGRWDVGRKLTSRMW